MSDNHQKNDQKQDEFLQQVQRNLAQATEQLDETTRQRLRQIRQQALQAGDKGSTRAFGAWVADLGLFQARGRLALAMTLLLAVMVVWQINRSGTHNPSDDELMLLSMQDEFDMVEQLEFYEWLTVDDANNS